MQIKLSHGNLNNIFNRISRFNPSPQILKLSSLNTVKDMDYLYFIDNDRLLLYEYI